MQKDFVLFLLLTLSLLMPKSSPALNKDLYFKRKLKELKKKEKAILKKIYSPTIKIPYKARASLRKDFQFSIKEKPLPEDKEILNEINNKLSFAIYRLSKGWEEITLLKEKIRFLDEETEKLDRKNLDIRERLFAVERALFKREELGNIGTRELKNDKLSDKQRLKQALLKKPLASAISRALLRTAPFEEADPLAVINKGEIVYLERVKEGWSQIKTDIGLKGWVKTSKIAYLNN